MRKLTKVLVMILFITIAFVGKNVEAKEVYYTNSSGVEFTKEQYDFYTYLTHEGFQEYVTQDMLEEVNWDDLDSMDVKVVRMCTKEPSNMGSTSQPQQDNLFFKTEYKGIMIGKYCNKVTCRVTTDVEWYGEPNVKSHDVIGAFLDGPTRLTEASTVITSSTTGSYEEITIYEDDGFGAVFQVPTGDDVTITQTFLYSGTGTIYSTYQHAKEGISYENAQKFHIAFSGFGNVLDFYGKAYDIYDKMPGVCIDV